MATPKPVQPSLYDAPPVARLTDPKTSHDAARGIDVKSIRGLILQTLSASNTPLASFQIAEKLGKERDSISPHMKPLERLKLIKRSGQTVKRPNGRQCETWIRVIIVEHRVV